jgi:GNAT superfamily N-acetyltransferase
LPAIETEAGRYFRHSAYPWIADEPNGMDEALIRRCQDTWCLWVVVGTDDLPVGFGAFGPQDDQIWLGELSVLPQHHGRRLGAGIIGRAAAFYGGRGFSRMTVTTFHDVPWNGPYYQRLGFSVIDDLSREPFLAAQIEKEEGWGAPAGSRVAMQRAL